MREGKRESERERERELESERDILIYLKLMSGLGLKDCVVLPKLDWLRGVNISILDLLFSAVLCLWVFIMEASDNYHFHSTLHL